MSWWLNWLVLLIGYGFLFVFWGWIPIEKLDRYWRLNNEVGRPFLNTVVLTGIPALYAKLTITPLPWLLVPLTFLLTQYAVLTGRFLMKPFIVAGWVFVITTVAIGGSSALLVKSPSGAKAAFSERSVRKSRNVLAVNMLR